MREFKRSLGADPNKRQDLYVQHLAEFERLLANARLEAAEFAIPSGIASGALRQLKYLTDTDRSQLSDFVESWQARLLGWHDEQIAGMSDEEITDYEQGLIDRRDLLKAGLRRMTPPVAWVAEVDELLETELNVRLLDECPERTPFLMHLLGEELRAIKESLVRFQADDYSPTPVFSSTPAVEQVADRPQLPNTAPSRSVEYRLVECLEAWNATSGKKEKSRREFSAIFTKFIAFVGGHDVPVEKVRAADIRGRKHVIEWLESVARTQLVERKTLVKHLAVVRAVLEVGVARDELADNPAMSIRLDALKIRGLPAAREGHAKESKAPFDRQEITQYFSHIDYWLSDSRLERSVAYWFPLMLFAFGARPEEIATLMRDDIRVAENGEHWIHIFAPTLSPDGRDRKPKHQASIRHLPVPDWLLRLGFAEYVHNIPFGQWLLPCKAAEQGEDAESSEGRAQQTLNYLNPFLRQIVGITDPKKSTYSLRHTFSDELRRARVQQRESDALTGHANKASNAGSTHYGSEWYPEEPLRAVIETLRHEEYLPDGFPAWSEFSQKPTPTERPKLLKK